MFNSIEISIGTLQIIRYVKKLFKEMTKKPLQQETLVTVC